MTDTPRGGNNVSAHDRFLATSASTFSSIIAESKSCRKADGAPARDALAERRSCCSGDRLDDEDAVALLPLLLLLLLLLIILFNEVVAGDAILMKVFREGRIVGGKKEKFNKTRRIKAQKI